MKRLFLVAALFFSAAVAKADYSPSLQSTISCNSQGNALVSTGSIRLVRIVVSSPTFNNSSITVYNSTTGSSGLGYNPNTSTFTFLATNATTFQPFQIDYDQVTSSGLVISKQGAACTSVFWRFNYPDSELEGISGRIPLLNDYRP